MNGPRAGGLRQVRVSILVQYGLIALLYVVATVGFFSNQQATDSLCALRGDLERRVATSQTFLNDHPAGIPGVPVKTIRDAIDNQKRTIRALSGLSCPD